jgi:hypothetical protein
MSRENVEIVRDGVEKVCWRMTSRSCPVTTKSFLDPAEALEAAGLRE